MATFADLFKACYLTGGSDVEFSKVRVHFTIRSGRRCPIHIAPGTRRGVPVLLARCRGG